MMKKGKILLCLLMFFTIQAVRSQTNECEINGAFANTTTYKYAYLLDFKLKTLMYTPIVQNHFTFKVEKTKDYQIGYLFFEQDSTRSFNYFSEQTKKTTENYRTLGIENTEILFEKDVKHVKVKTGQLNKDIVQMYAATNSGEFDLFFDQHPDSPLTLSILKALLVVNKNGGKYDCKALYDKLTERIKQSAEGKEIFVKL